MIRKLTQQEKIPYDNSKYSFIIEVNNHVHFITKDEFQQILFDINYINIQQKIINFCTCSPNDKNFYNGVCKRCGGHK